MRLINADEIVYESIDSADTMREEIKNGTGILAVRKEDIDAMPTIETEERTEERTETHACDSISRQEAIALADHLKDDLPDDERIADLVIAHNEGVLAYQTALSLLPFARPESTERIYKRGYADGYHKAEKDYFKRTEKDRDDAFKAGVEIGRTNCGANMRGKK